MRSRIPIAIALVLAFSLVPVAARADAGEEARRHYQQGTILFDLGRYREAAHEYEEAYVHKPEPVLLFNAAQAYRLGEAHADALRAYKAYLRRLPEAPNRKEVEARIRALQEIIEKSTAVATSPPGGTLTPSPSVARPPATAAPATAPAAPHSTPAAAPPPAAATAPARAPSASATPPAAATPTPAPTAVTTAPAPSSRDPMSSTPVARRWWLWTAVGAAVAVGVGVGVGLALGLPNDAPAPPGAYTVSF